MPHFIPSHSSIAAQSSGESFDVEAISLSEIVPQTSTSEVRDILSWAANCFRLKTVKLDVLGLFWMVLN